ncbi:hypothetical protein Zmor_024362 [Zophobas morio]|uniref:Uncharacterized protein n=1 Tax=Zophobas morio TaxID=2755281 RepID=A0AA38M7M6_9CUCU|nr:hypothetical protein Zmor_024362 [Zophobas morio]
MEEANVANVNQMRMPCVVYNQETIGRAHQLFVENSLPEFFVAHVEAVKCLGKTPCRWLVAYKFRDDHREYAGGDFAKRLVRRFDAAKPRGTNIMKPAIHLFMSLNDGLRYMINYGVLYNCEYNETFFGEGDDGPFNVNELPM